MDTGFGDPDASLARTVRRLAVAVAAADLLAAAATLAFIRDVYVASAAGFAVLVAIAYLGRVTRGSFAPYGGVALFGWIVVNATMSPGSLVGQGVCMAGMAFVLASAVSPVLADRRYARFMALTRAAQAAS